MKNQIIYSIFILLLISNVSFAQEQLDLYINEITPSNQSSCSAPYFTLDEQNSPVLVWTISNKKSKKNHLSYAKWNNARNQFNNTNHILQTIGMQKHKESMGKIGFKSDGSILAIYGVKAPTPQNRFAGYTAYHSSIDSGKTWSKRYKLVPNNVSENQRFFDIERLGDGELGVVWLDARKLEADNSGSTLYFAKTNATNKIVNEMAIAGSVCQCCRTDIFVDTLQNIHIAYRDIIQDTIRDMQYLNSNDNGLNFGTPKRIGYDNWVINGCPHTGPSIASSNNKTAFSWFTVGDEQGVYFTDNNKMQDSIKIKLGSELSHPQIIGIENGNFVVVADEIANIGEIYFNRIVLLIIESDGNMKKYFITKKDSNNSHPVIQRNSKGDILVAWTKHKKESDIINYVIINETILN